MENQPKSLTIYTLQQGLGNMHHNRYLRCKNCKEKHYSDCWHCFECCAEGQTAHFCPEKQRNISTIPMNTKFSKQVHLLDLTQMRLIKQVLVTLLRQDHVTN